MSSDDDDAKPLVDFVALGSDLVGGTSGAGLGFVVGGPVGALAGQAAGVAASHALKAAAVELKRVWLSRRQEVRVGGVLAAAVTEFARRIDNGETLRSDGFFDNSNKRSSAEEVIERALVVAVACR